MTEMSTMMRMVFGKRRREEWLLALPRASHYTAPGTLFNSSYCNTHTHTHIHINRHTAHNTHYTARGTLIHKNTIKVYTTDNPWYCFNLSPDQKEAVHTVHIKYKQQIAPESAFKSCLLLCTSSADVLYQRWFNIQILCTLRCTSELF